jgi:hypothetical protein
MRISSVVVWEISTWQTKQNNQSILPPLTHVWHKMNSENKKINFKFKNKKVC